MMVTTPITLNLSVPSNGCEATQIKYTLTYYVSKNNQENYCFKAPSNEQITQNHIQVEELIFEMRPIYSALFVSVRAFRHDSPR